MKATESENGIKIDGEDEDDYLRVGEKGESEWQCEYLRDAAERNKIERYSVEWLFAI